jgi:hypothetical protein
MAIAALALGGATARYGGPIATNAFIRGQTALVARPLLARTLVGAAVASNFVDDAALVYTGLTGDAQARADAYTAYQIGAADGYLPFADIVAAGKILSSQLSRRTGCFSTLSKEAIIAELLAGTQQAQRIAEGLDRGRIGLNVLNEEMFVKAYEYYYRKQYGHDPLYITADAFAWNNKIFVANDSDDILGRIVHEGTHALDYLNGNVQKMTTHQLEKRAWFQERMFQLWMDQPTQFSTIDEMIQFIKQYYGNP